jgi:hypothetical protein
MIRQLAIATSAALLTYALQPAAVAQVPDRVDWTIAPAGADQANRVQFSIGYRRGRSSNNWSNTTDLAELPGLTAGQLAADNAPVRFQIVREAGRFDCEGVVRRGRGTGECSFTADPAFTAALARHRIAAPTREQSYSLALARVSIAMVEELARQGYQTPDADDLVGAGIHRVDAAYIRDMAAAGYRVGRVEGLVAMRIHRVTPDYISALAAAGYRPNAEMAVQMRIHGATPDYIRALGAAGATGFDTDDLVALRIHGVRPEFVGELRTLGYERLSAEDLTSMRIHGVSADFVRRANEDAGRRLTPDELVSERINPRRARIGSRS